MSKPEPFKHIAVKFENNISALRVFNEQIGQLAEEHDRSIIRRHNETMSKLLGVNLADLPSNELPERVIFEFRRHRHRGESLVDTTDDVEQTADGAGSNAIKEGNSEKTFRSNKDSIIVQADHEQVQDIVTAINSMRSILRKGSPRQARILRCGALITLSSYFEVLVAELIQGYYLRYPKAMPSEERILSLADLRDIGSVEEAEKHLIWKEVDSVIRESVNSQLDYFSKRLKLGLQSLDPYLDELFEIFQRRNLLVHNDGVVNRIYLTKTPAEFIERQAIKEGEILNVTQEYLAQSINLILLCGNILLQLCWRKWSKEDIEKADEYMIEIVYNALLDRNFDLATNFAEFGSKLAFGDDKSARIILINHAIALKEMNMLEEMEKLLSTRDWSSCSSDFRLAMLALRDDKDSFFQLLPKVIVAENLPREALDEWPLFSHMREDSRYAQIYENHFPKLVSTLIPVEDVNI